MVELREEERELLMLEHKELLDEILRRRQNTWLIHSILLAATFIISFGPNPALLPIPYIVSLVLAVFAWLFQRTARHVNKSCWNRRTQIEKLLGMTEPQHRYEKLKETGLYKIRRSLWPAFFGFVIIVYSVLIIHYFLMKLLPCF